MRLLFPIQQPRAAQDICILITDSIEGAVVCNGSFRWGCCTPAPGWEAYLTGLHLKWGSDIITNNSKTGKKPRIDQIQKDLVPFPPRYLFLPICHSLMCVSPPLIAYKAKIRPGRPTSLEYLISAAFPFQRARNTKSRSTPPPEVCSSSRLFHTGSPRLVVHLATNIYSALPQRGQFKLHWCWGDCWSQEIFRCHDMSNK